VATSPRPRLIFIGEMSLLSKSQLAPTYSFEHHLFGKPVPTFPDHALVSFEHHLFGKPLPTPLSKCGAGFFLDHALDAERAAQPIATPESVSLVSHSIKVRY
jgi:hypothetical protein